MAGKVIITCALTGSGHTPSMSPYLPYTVSDLVDQGVAAAEAGAAVLHVHARNPEDGSQTLRTVAEKIALVQNIGGG